jgi:TIR domain
MTAMFISYSRKDQIIIDTLSEELQDLGLKVWIDRSGIRGGHQWRVEIVNAIRDCDVFLLCMSSASVASDNVRRELDIAASERKKIIPLRLEKVQFPAEWQYQLAGIQWIDYEDRHWAARLMNGIGNKEGLVPVQRPLREEPRKQKKDFRWSWTAIAILALLGLFFWLIIPGNIRMGGVVPTMTSAPALTSTVAEVQVTASLMNETATATETSV